MPSFDDVVRAAVPGAAELTRGSGRARPVNWVRVMRSRVPAFDALEPADVAVVPEAALLAVVHDEAEAAAVADELHRADVAGVVLVPAAAPDGGVASPGASAGEVSGAFVAAARHAGLTIFRGPKAGDIERDLIRYLVNARAEVDRQIARLEGELQQAALEGGGIQSMAAAIAGFFRRAVAIENADGSLVALHAPGDPPTAAVAAARYEARRGRVALRRELPGGGALALLGEGPVSELEAAGAERVAGLVAMEFSRDSALRRVRDRGETMPAEGPPWVVLMSRQSIPGEETTIAERERRREKVNRLGSARRLLLRGDAQSVELRVIAAATRDDPRGLELAERIADVLGRPVAVSKSFDAPTARPQADAEARALLEAADEMAGLQSPPAVLRADRLAMYRLLGSLHNLPDGERHARALLAPVLDGSSARRAARVATLRALLDGAGPAEAAASLGVHRNTIAYRIRALEAATGWDLADRDLRLALGVALRLVRNAQN